MATVERKDLATVAEVKGTSEGMTVIAEQGGSIVRVPVTEIAPYREEDVMYGVEWDTAKATPDCTRIGNVGLHKTLPIHSLMRGCLLADDGTVNKYLSPADWTAEDRSGAGGQVMVEIPKMWVKFETEGTVNRVKMSLYPLPGYTAWRKMYVSAYEAAMDRTNNVLCSVVNTGARYRGGDNDATANADGGETSLLGRPVTVKSLTDFRSLARKRKTGGTEWNCMTYLAQVELWWLFVVEYATLNSQKAYNAQLTSEGYRQGGLGDGVATLDNAKWTAWNRQMPFVPCGYTDALGNGTGVKEYTMPAVYDTAGAKKVGVPRYRGVENPFGHVLQWTDGILIEMNPESGSGLARIFRTDDPAKFSSTSVSGHTYVGNAPKANGFIKKIAFGEGGDIIATETGGGSTTYYCDSLYIENGTISAVTLHGVCFGGAANFSSSTGLACAYANNVPSLATASRGSRLCFIPNA